MLTLFAMVSFRRARCLAIGSASLVAACHANASPYSLTGIGDADRGRQLVSASGCGACHVIPGIESASGTVGPPLTHWARRSYIAGVLPNAPAQLELWVRSPQTVKPGDAMPNLVLSERDAADIGAYLYSLR
jgi:cytochrome c1